MLIYTISNIRYVYYLIYYLYLTLIIHAADVPPYSLPT